MIWGVKLAALLVSGAVAQQRVFHGASVKHAITPDISALANRLLKEGNIHGLSVGVIHSSDAAEYMGWGLKTEEGDPMNPEVSASFSIDAHADPNS